MARQFVPGGDDAAHHRWMPFGDPAQGEERRLHAGRIEHAQDAIDVGLDPRGQPSQAVRGMRWAKACTWK